MASRTKKCSMTKTHDLSMSTSTPSVFLKAEKSQATPAAFLSIASGARVRHYSGTTRNWMLPLVVIMFHLLISAAGADDETQGSTHGGAKPSPHFDTPHLDNHTVQLGAIAFLPCTIKNLGNKSVSWIRASDAHILTVDHEVFISDPRFQAIHQANSSAWTLQIKSVQPNDAGKYECQISTLPKMSHFLHLSVIVPNVKIYGDRDIFVKSSSTVQLRCVVSQSLVPPTYIEWRHNDEHLPLATSALSIGSHKGARLQTTPPEHIAAGTTVSTLTILQAEISDSGKYTCLPAQLESASVNLHVLETDLPALMQTSGSSNRGSTLPTSILVIMLVEAVVHAVGAIPRRLVFH